MTKAKIIIAETEQEFEVESGVIMYDAIASQGLELPHGCLSGSCGACRVDVILGVENLKPAGVIEQNTIDAVRDEYRQKCGEAFLAQKNIRLSCRAKVCGNVTIRPLGGKGS